LLRTETGWTRHRAFGLRREWIELYLRHPADWRESGALGNRQVMSLDQWLITTGLLTRRDGETRLCSLMRSRGTGSQVLWALVWANVCLAFPTARWYVTELGLGEWPIDGLTESLCLYCGLAKRTCYDAIMELVGLLERTPIGKELKQGEVIRAYPRLVRRIGLADPGPEAILYAAGALFARERRCRLELQEPLPWPWIVFGCRPEEALATLSAYGSGWFEVRPHSLELLGPMEGLPYAVVC
jgi:hypothetical protein